MKCWTLYLVLPGRFRSQACSRADHFDCAAIRPTRRGILMSTGIFFAVILSYLPAVHAYILEITRNAILELRSNLLMTDEDIADITERMHALNKVSNRLAGWHYISVTAHQLHGFHTHQCQRRIGFFWQSSQGNYRRHATDMVHDDHSDL